MFDLRTVDAQPFDGPGVGELPEAFEHRGPKEAEGMRNAASEDDRLGIVGVERQHDQPSDVASELVPQRQRFGIARRPFAGLLARRAPADEETAAAIVFVVAVQIGNAADLARSGVGARVEFAVDHDAGPHARSERDARHVAAVVGLAEAADAQREAVAVVVHVHRQAEPLFEPLLEMHFAPRGDARHVIYDAPHGIHHRRHADADARHAGRYQRSDERGDVFQHLLLRTVGPAGLRKQTHDASAVHQAGTYVRAAQIHAYSHRFAGISVIRPSAKRA